MKTVAIEIKGLLSALSALGIEKQLLRLPGVHTAAVYYVAGSATVGYDEIATDLQTIVARVDECGYHCAGGLTRVGVRFKACRISMRAPGYTDADFPLEVEFVPAGISEMIRLQMQGYATGAREAPSAHPAQQESCFTSLLKVCAASFKPSTIVR